MDITGLDPARVLRALYNFAKAQGNAALWYVPGDMSITHARQLLEAGDVRNGAVYFDYLKGRILKVHIPVSTKTSAVIDLRLYDRDNGEGAGELVISEEFEMPGEPV